MSGWVNTRAALRIARPTSRPPSISSRSFSVWRQHDANLRAKKDAIRQHIRALEVSRRKFSGATAYRHGHIDPPKPGEELHVTFIDKDGDQHEFEVAEGDNLLDIAQANDLEMEGEVSEACSATYADTIRRMWRFLRLLDLSCNCSGRRHVRQDTRSRRR